MKHLVTLSLVFFSLTHLAKAERVEVLRILTERYCNKQQITAQTITQDPGQLNDYQNPFFLTYNELASIGLIPKVEVDRYVTRNQTVADLTTVGKPKNNSP